MAAVENTTDDGTLEAFPSEANDDETEPEDCDFDGLGGFPCWPCVKTGPDGTAELTTASVLSLSYRLTTSNFTDQRTPVVTVTVDSKQY